eukprot:jgi/Ulvmu1/10444/UM062_0041.1
MAISSGCDNLFLCERLLGQTNVNTQAGLAEVTQCILAHISSISSSGLINVLSLALLLSGQREGQDLAASAVRQLPPSSIPTAPLYLRHFVQLLLITSAFASVSRDRKSSLHQPLAALSRAVQDHVTSITPAVTVRDAVTACKIVASFRHRHYIPSATLQPVCVALSTHAERSLLEYNATQLIITLTSLHACGHAPKTLYAAVSAALATDRLGYLSSRHRVSLIDAFDAAGQPLPPPLRHCLVCAALDASASLTRAEDVARLARAAAATAGLPPARGLPLAEHLVRHAAELPPATLAATLAALLRLGCVHGGAVAAFRGAAAPRFAEMRWWELTDAAACCANTACADLWPQVRVAAARCGALAEATVTAAYLHALVSDSPALDCQRVADAASALTTLLQAKDLDAMDGAGAIHAEATTLGRDMRGASKQLHAELAGLTELLSGSAARPPEVEELLAAAAAWAEPMRMRRRRPYVDESPLVRWRSKAEAVEWLQGARPFEVVQAVRAAAGAPEADEAGGSSAAEAQEAICSSAEDAVRQASPAVLQQYLAALSRGKDAPAAHDPTPSISNAALPMPAPLQSLLDTASARLQAICAPAHRQDVDPDNVEAQIAEETLLAAGWTLHVAVGMATAQLRLCSEDHFEADGLVPQIARMLLLRAGRAALSEADALLCAQAARLSERAEAQVARGAELPTAWRQEVRQLGLAAADALATAPAATALPLHAYADVAAAATPGGPADTEALRRWATGAAAAAALRAATPAAAGEARAVAKLLRAAAAGAAAPQALPELRAAAAEYTAVVAATLPVLSLAGLSSALHRSGSRSGHAPATATACAALERELVLRPANDLKSAQAGAQILYHLVCMNHAPSRGVAATLAATLEPHIASMPPVAAVRAIWALGRCGHAATPLLEYVHSELRRLTHSTRAAAAALSPNDRRAAAVFATGAPWALASASASFPQGLAASTATLSANLAAAEPAVLRASPNAHLSSFLWGLSTVRPAVDRRVLRRLFSALAARVLPHQDPAATPPAPRDTVGLPQHSTRISFTACAAARSVGQQSVGDGVGGAGPLPLEVPAVAELAPLDCVNVLVASARFRFYDGRLLRHAVEQLAAADSAALATLSLSRLTDLADALGSLRIYNGPVLAAVTPRLVAALSPPAAAGPSASAAPALGPHALATWLFMYASLRHHDAAVLDAVSSFAARNPAARFRSLAALSSALWAFARLTSHPSRFLDLCHLSAPDLLLPFQQDRAKLTIEVQCQLIRVAWALMVLKEWEHPLLQQVLFCLSAAPTPPPQARSEAPAADDGPAAAPDDTPTVAPEDTGADVTGQWQVPIDGTAAVHHAVDGGVAGVEAQHGEQAWQEAEARGATGSDRRRPLRVLPRFAQLQLAQCVLLASAAGEADLLALLPEHLRRSCGTAWREEVNRKCASNDDGEPVSVGMLEGTVASALKQIQCMHSMNVRTPDGLLHLDFLLHETLEGHASGMKYVALELWGTEHVAENCLHALAKAAIRRRLAAARGVLLVPLPWREWRQVIGSAAARSAYLQAKLRAAGVAGTA